MTRCDARLCDRIVGDTGFTCVVCKRSFCAHHTNAANLELQCCDNDMRDCSGCGQTRPANDGAEIGRDFMCRICLADSAVLNVELAPPSIPIFEEPLESVA